MQSTDFKSIVSPILLAKKSAPKATKATPKRVVKAVKVSAKPVRSAW